MQNPPFDWAEARQLLTSRFGTEVVSRWLDPLAVASVTEDAVVLEAPNPFFRDWVTAHYLEAIKPHAGGRAIRVVTQAAASAPGATPQDLSPGGTPSP